jgi:inner membrane protein
MVLAAAAKPLVIAFLALVLLVPVGQIQSLVAERQQRRNEALEGIAQGWGARQTLASPYLAVPYQYTRTEVTRETVDGAQRERRTERVESLVLRIPAEALQWSVVAGISEKARGIYKARLYTARIEVQGRLALPARFGVNAGEMHKVAFGQPRLVLGISDPRGIRSVSALSLGGGSYDFRPAPGDSHVAAGLHAVLASLSAEKPADLPFSFSLELAGSEALAIAPLGADSAISMRADWPHPSFQGQFLPARHEVEAGGFSASWKISRYAAQGSKPLSSAETLGVSFIEPAGLYQRLERASKYGFLFIGLTFAAFLLFELLRRLAIHPVQYGLVGLALAMFFLLLTALSEHVQFLYAYLTASAACVGLLTTYLARVLRSTRLGLAFGGALAGLYAMLYVLIRAEDYALLGGTLMLFALLAAVMLATRKVDWYSLSPKSP